MRIKTQRGGGHKPPSSSFCRLTRAQLHFFIPADTLYLLTKYRSTWGILEGHFVSPTAIPPMTNPKSPYFRRSARNDTKTASALARSDLMRDSSTITAFWSFSNCARSDSNCALSVGTSCSYRSKSASRARNVSTGIETVLPSGLRTISPALALIGAINKVTNRHAAKILFLNFPHLLPMLLD